ncbi:MAG: T9SS type A sorting domain-containing protein [Verrucomicrobiales bacterium]|nr:T9SS type A sorting domain-containing protein [Verrucomicrobiales bacterium]
MNQTLPSSALVLIFSALLAVTNGRAGEINHARFVAQQAALPALEGPDAFTLRESWLKGTLSPGEAKLVPQQLFKRNSYQFWFAVPDSDAEVLLNIYDGLGRLMETDTVKVPGKSNVISIVVTPKSTGIYYLRLSVSKETEKAQEWALIYAYK